MRDPEQRKIWREMRGEDCSAYESWAEAEAPVCGTFRR